MAFGAGPGPSLSQSISMSSQFQVAGQGNQWTEPNQVNSTPSEQDQMNHGEMDVVRLAEGEENSAVDEFDLEPINLKAQVCQVLNLLAIY